MKAERSISKITNLAIDVEGNGGSGNNNVLVWSDEFDGTGSIDFSIIEGQSIAHLSGNVSTENNGGFIQFRRNMKGITLDGVNNIKIIAKGKGKQIHLIVSPIL